VELIGVYITACLLLVGAGVAKALHPDDTARALVTSTTTGGTRLGASAARRVVRSGAMGEALLGAAGLVLVNRAVAAGVAVSYGAFAAYVALVRRRGGPLATCGCFGTPDTPATRLHVVLDAGLALAALSVAIETTTGGSGGSMASLLWHQPWHGVPLAGTAVLCAWVIVHTLSTLPRLQAVRHQESP
jgi:hypothetical protein